ncbi:Thyrotropin-releasing hormone receptor [Sarcoptes scabiei]|uniref:Thyrotropin-releasing hormone receptor n=1 Tax=Sarcoptes scabiei TaxID=52283 RepID=A0A834R6J4_SARSC|nr:Thyrotropin-releasing hormone receptor [Sarcoptes scabiei]
MVVIVVLRSRSMRTPTNCYLVSLAVADTMVLLASVPNEIIAYYLLGDKWIWGPIGCALFIFLQYLGINASSLSIAAFTVERYIAICHPMLAHKLCTVRRAKRIILYVWMFATAYCSPWLFLTKTEKIHYLWIDSDVYTCKFKLNREHYKGYYLTDIVLFYLLPLAISCVLYALIARVLYNSNDLLKQQQIDCSARGSSSGSGGGTAKTSIDMQNDSVPFSEQNFDPSSPTSSMFLGRTKFQKNFSVTSESYSEIAGTDHSNQFQHCNESEHCSHHNQRTQPLKIRSNFRFHLPNQSYSSASMMATSGNRNNFPNSTGGIKKTLPSDSSRVQVVKMLGVVVAVFATLWLPYRALVVYNSFSFPPYMELWYLMFAKTMIFVNSAINPIIYSACSMKFRREFRRMLTCGGRNNFSSKAKQTHRTFNKSTKLRQLSRSDAIALNLMSDLDDSTSALRSKRVKQLESNCKTFDCTDRIAQQHRSDSNDSSYLPDSANHSDQSNQPIAFNHQKNVRFVRKTEYDSKNFKNSKGFH